MYHFCFRHLLNVSLQDDGLVSGLVFNLDGTTKHSNLKIVNLRPTVGTAMVHWEEVRDEVQNIKVKICNAIP